MAHNISQEGFPNIPLTDGMILRLEARDTATNAPVAGVTCSLWAIYGDDQSAADLPALTPLYTPEDVSP